MTNKCRKIASQSEWEKNLYKKALHTKLKNSYSAWVHTFMRVWMWANIKSNAAFVLLLSVIEQKMKKKNGICFATILCHTISLMIVIEIPRASKTRSVYTRLRMYETVRCIYVYNSTHRIRIRCAISLCVNHSFMISQCNWQCLLLVGVYYLLWLHFTHPCRRHHHRHLRWSFYSLSVFFLYYLEFELFWIHFKLNFSTEQVEFLSSNLNQFRSGWTVKKNASTVEDTVIWWS